MDDFCRTENRIGQAQIAVSSAELCTQSECGSTELEHR